MGCGRPHARPAVAPLVAAAVGCVALAVASRWRGERLPPVCEVVYLRAGSAVPWTEYGRAEGCHSCAGLLASLVVRVALECVLEREMLLWGQKAAASASRGCFRVDRQQRGFLLILRSVASSLQASFLPWGGCRST